MTREQMRHIKESYFIYDTFKTIQDGEVEGIGARSRSNIIGKVT